MWLSSKTTTLANFPQCRHLHMSNTKVSVLLQQACHAPNTYQETIYILQLQPLVLEVWFTNFSSTGSRRVIPHGVNLTCAAPATVSRRAFMPSFHQLPLSALKQVLGKAMKVVLLSPDTGQQGGPSQEGSNVRALSGKAVRTHLLVKS